MSLTTKRLARHRLRFDAGDPQGTSTPSKARAVQAMLHEGYNLDGAAPGAGLEQAARHRPREDPHLPDAGQQLVGSGAMPASAIDNVLAILTGSPTLADAAIANGTIEGPNLARDPAWAINRAVSAAPKAKWRAAPPDDLRRAPHQGPADHQQERPRAAHRGPTSCTARSSSTPPDRRVHWLDGPV